MGFGILEIKTGGGGDDLDLVFFDSKSVAVNVGDIVITITIAEKILDHDVAVSVSVSVSVSVCGGVGVCVRQINKTIYAAELLLLSVMYLIA